MVAQHSGVTFFEEKEKFMMNRKDKKAKAKTGFLTWALVKVGITVMLITSGLIYGKKESLYYWLVNGVTNC